jgi:flagellar biosynthetic protein FlhB
MSGERTEAPTPRRRQDARRQGNVAKSHELVTSGVLLAAVIALRNVGPGIWNNLAGVVHDGLAQRTSGDLTPDVAMGLGLQAAQRALLALAPLFAIIAITSIALNLAQTGLLLNGSSLKPKASRLNPATGAKRLVSKQGGVEFLKAIAKMIAAGTVVAITLRGQLGEIAMLGQMPPRAAGAMLASLAFDVAIRGAVALFFVAVLDWVWQRRQYMSKLRMTREEVKQEMKESDGDPQVKAAIRRKRQQLMNRMISAVPRADVVVTNPTHYAVALKYDPVSMAAPMVIAKGEQLLAQRIKEVARRAGIPVLEEPPLARALYAAVPVGQYIPGNLFHAVAEVLAFVYSLRSRLPGLRPQGAH